MTDCRRRSTSHTVYSLCSYVTRWHGAVSALTETAGMRKAKRARPSFEKFSTTILLAYCRRLAALRCRARCLGTARLAQERNAAPLIGIERLTLASANWKHF